MGPWCWICWHWTPMMALMLFSHSMCTKLEGHRCYFLDPNAILANIWPWCWHQCEICFFFICHCRWGTPCPKRDTDGDFYDRGVVCHMTERDPDAIFTLLLYVVWSLGYPDAKKWPRGFIYVDRAQTEQLLNLVHDRGIYFTRFGS